MVKAQETIDLNSVKPLNDIADNTNQHFWFWDTIPTGKDPSVGTGAHISEVPESEFNDPNSPNYHSGGNLLARSNGIAVRDGLTEFAVFGAEGARVGANGGANVIIEDVQTLFHGNNGELVGAINSGAVISGSFTEDVNNVIGSVTSNIQLPWTIASGRLAYPPNGDITFSWESPSSYKENYVVHRSDWFSKTIDSTQDCDVTEDGVRIVYNASTRRYELTYVSLYPVAYVVTNKYYSSWPNPVVDGTHLTVTNTQRLNNSQVVTLLLDPIAGDPINMSLYDATYNTNLSLWFDAGTAETKTVTYPNYPQYSATASYDGNKTITITNSRNYAFTISISYDVLLGYVGDFKITYDREFLAPRYSFGVFNEDSDDYSLTAVFGEGLTTGASNQTIVGRYNESGNKAFYVGSGDNINSRANAMEVDWNGNTTIAGTLTQGSDKRLKEHIEYLSEDAIKFIRKLKPAHFLKDEEHHVGFYAQDVKEADEWDCMTGEMNGYMTLGYTELIAPLVAYCHSLEERIRKLEEK